MRIDDTYHCTQYHRHSKVIPLDSEVLTTEDKKSIKDKISEIQKEKAVDKIEPQLEKQDKKLSELE